MTAARTSIDFKVDPIGWWHEKWDSTTRAMRESPDKVLDDAGMDEYLRIDGDWHRAVRQKNVLSRPDVRAVYFIQAANGLIKIGVSDSPSERIRQLQYTSPIRLQLIHTLPGQGAPGESKLHRRFAEHRSHGEWFYPAAEILAFIAQDCAARDADGTG